jgi:hypothetical protein
LVLLVYFLVPELVLVFERQRLLSASEWSTLVSVAFAFVVIPVWGFWRIVSRAPVFMESGRIAVGITKRSMDWSKVSSVQEDEFSIFVIGFNERLVISKIFVANPETVMEEIRSRVE